MVAMWCHAVIMMMTVHQGSDMHFV